jgi:hypothetical protein
MFEKKVNIVIYLKRRQYLLPRIPFLSYYTNLHCFIVLIKNKG